MRLGSLVCALWIALASVSRAAAPPLDDSTDSPVSSDDLDASDAWDELPDDAPSTDAWGDDDEADADVDAERWDVAPDTDALPKDPDDDDADVGASGPSVVGDYSSAFGLPVSGRSDPYGPRPKRVARLDLEQIIRYALDNPAVLAAAQEVEALQAELRKAKFAWVPIVTTEMSLMPGVNIQCDDLRLDDGTPNGFDFQYCRVGGGDINIYTIEGYFQQLSEAGVRLELEANILFPITGFGKLKFIKDAGKAGLAVRKLEKLATQQELTLRVHQAHSALLLARESIRILREAKDIADKALGRVEDDLGLGEESWAAEPGEVDLDRDPTDEFKVKLAVLELEQQMREALKVESLALSALWALAGERAPKHFDIEQTQLRRYGIEGGLLDMQEYKEMAARNRPEARMAAAAVEARQAQERLARAMFLPDLGVVVRLGYGLSTAADREMDQIYYDNRFNFSRATAALALRWKWDFHFKTFDLQKARATRRAAQYKAEAARLLLGRDVEEAYADLVEAMHLMATTEEAVALARRWVILNQQRDTVGGGNAGELLKALEKWYQQRFAYVEAIQLYNEAIARLSRAVGRSMFSPRTMRAEAAAPEPD